MFLSVVVASANRPEMLTETLESLANQTRPPDELILSTTKPADVGDIPERLRPFTRVITGPASSTRQRNAGIDASGAACDAISFMDDDVELAPDYLAQVAKFFGDRPDVFAFSGHVADLPAGTRAEARRLLGIPSEASFTGADGLYGCSMNVRRATALAVRFDERLSLYAWMEDYDFGRRCQAHGKVGFYTGCRLVHLGCPSGRVSEARFGYAQIMNPTYLFRKGTYGPARKLFVDNWLRALAANTLLAFEAASPGRRTHRGRLRGNLIAISQILTGRVNPEGIARVRD